MRHREKNKRVIGIDPGTIYCGYGLVERIGRDDIKYIISGRIELRKPRALHERLCELYINLIEIIKEFNPDEAIIEKVFFAKGYKAALNLGHARGIVLLAAAIEKLNIFEYSALEVKKSVAGYGRADKKQVNRMVSSILNLGQDLSEDSADALALAICHMNTINLSNTINKL